MDRNRDDRRTPGIPGKLGDLGWVDSPDYGGRPEDRRGLVVYDVDPAPLARLIVPWKVQPCCGPTARRWTFANLVVFVIVVASGWGGV